MLLNPLFDFVRMMNTQIVQNQIDFSTGIFDQPATKPNERLRVHGLVVNHKTNFALIRNSGDQINFVSFCIEPDSRRFPFWRIAPTMLAVAAKSCFIPPIDFGFLYFSFGDNFRILFIKPFLNRFRVLLIGPAKRFLRGKPPALEILADGSNRHLYGKKLADELLDRLAGPKCKRKFELIRSFCR